MKQCPSCAELVTDAAVVCKNCGRDLSGKPPPVVKVRHVDSISTIVKWGFWTILALFVVSAMVAISNLGERLLQTPEERAAEEERLATGIVTTVCERAVEQRLRAPSTAVFPPSHLSSVETLAPGRYRLASYVDAESAVGGTVRTTFVCIAEQSGLEGSGLDIEDYTVIDLIVN